MTRTSATAPTRQRRSPRSRDDVLLTEYRMNAPDTVVPSATTKYLRSTLVQLSNPGRVTLDAVLTCTRDGMAVTADPEMVLIESKSGRADAPVDRILREHGIRPVRISKYCLAVGVLYPDMHANPWHAAIRACFGRGGRRMGLFEAGLPG